MEIVYGVSEEQIRHLHGLYQTAWWAKGRSLEDTRRCVAGSQICIGLVDAQKKLIGFARVLTDYTFKALIFDVIVCESHRGKGLGDKLIELIKTHGDLARVRHFELYCLPDMNDFYVGHGFTSELGEFQFMRFSKT